MKTVAFDLSRMFVGAASNTPRGIDRVDMGYATRIFSDPAEQNVGLLPSPHHMGVLGGEQARKFAAAVEACWREDAKPGEDALFEWLRRRLAGERRPRPPSDRKELVRSRAVFRYAKLLRQASPWPFRPAVSSVPQGAVYLNVGQVLLGCGWFFDWLDRRPDVKPVFMMHDLIPVIYPEYSSPGLSRHHARAVDTIVRRAAAMIATSHASADEIRDVLKARGRGDMPIHVVQLPVSDGFLASRSATALASEPPYFVTVGAIEMRKNQLMLLHIWREMGRRLPASKRPKLVIVGARARRADMLVDFIQRCPGLEESVIEVNGLSTPAMRELIRDARALLMPSFTEGFGLPIVEALALGTPVIASDIPAHCEVGGSFGAYLDPLDGTSWLAELDKRGNESAAATQERRAVLADYRPQTWTSYFDEILPFINSL